MEWIALKHALLSHLPVAMGLLLPLPLIASQRAGRGIRPWWRVARYVGWAGLLGTLSAVVSGLASGRFMGHIAARRILPELAAGTGPDGLLVRHTLLAGVSLLLGLAAMWAMSRHRKDHESLGILTLVLGLAWSAVTLATGVYGNRLAHGHQLAATAAATPAAIPAPAPARPSVPKVDPDPESERPLRVLDYAALEPIHPDPVKSLAHGGRWVRAYASPEAAAAYRAGGALPQGALVVLSSVEDRWGRPGPDAGPICALEMKPAGPSLTFYWARIPMEHRREFGGDSRVYWRGGDVHLDTCRACHATGMADPAKRSRWRAKRFVPSE
jgi:uncharacterized membrane protein